MPLGGTRVVDYDAADIEVDPDADQGTAVFILDTQGDFETADLLEMASVRYQHFRDEMGDDGYNVLLEVDITLLESFSEDVTDRIGAAFRQVVRGSDYYISQVLPHPKRIAGD